MVPRLLYERLDELGLDFSVLYPTTGLAVPFISNDEVRRAACRAFNTFAAEQFATCADRLTPAAVVPVNTPAEAIDELEHVAKTLKLKVVVMGSVIKRPIPAAARRSPELARYATWFDMFGLDSAYDYDPVSGEVRRAWNRTDLSYQRPRLWDARVGFELHLQSYWAFRGLG